MNGLIVAAGRSSRLYPRTIELPKCMLKIDGERLIDRALRLFRENGVEKIYLVVGFQSDKLVDYLGKQVEYIYNPFYASTNNMASLWMAIPHLGRGELLYSHSDLIYHPEILRTAVEQRSQADLSLIYDPDSIHQEAMKIQLSDGKFQQSSKEIPLAEADGEWTGLSFFSQNGLESFTEMARELLLDGQFNAYDTAAFNRLAEQGAEFQLLQTGGRPWREIDDEVDLAAAREDFAS